MSKVLNKDREFIILNSNKNLKKKIILKILKINLSKIKR